MINLEFSEKELDTLKDYFQAELHKAQEKLTSIRGILDKIGKKAIKVSKEEKRAAKKEIKKVLKLNKLFVPEEKVRKRSVSKQKTAVPVVGEPVIVEKKKRGRPPKVKVEVKAPAQPKTIQTPVIAEVPVIVKTRGRKKAQIAEVPKVEGKIRRPRIAKEKVNVAAMIAPEVSEPVIKRKPGRPAKVKEVEAVKKPRVKAVKAVKAVVVPKEPKKVLKKKAPKIPWGAWVLTSLRDHEENLTKEAIIDNIARRLQLSGEELSSATQKISEQMLRLQKTGKILPVAEGDLTTYALKILGKKA